MSQISLNLPPGAVLQGDLLESYQGSDWRLNQDILQVSLPSGITIDVGWWPEYDPAGHFVIVVYREHWEDQEQAPINVRTPKEVATVVESIANAYIRPSIRLTASPRSISYNIPIPLDRLNPGSSTRIVSV